MSAVLICPNQHGSFQGQKFCTVCGAALVAPSAQAEKTAPSKPKPTVVFSSNETSGKQPQSVPTPERPSGQAVNPPPNQQPPHPPQPPVPPINPYPPPQFAPPGQPNFAPPQQNIAPPQHANFAPPANNPMPRQNFAPNQPQQNFAPQQPPPNFAPRQPNFAPQPPSNFPSQPPPPFAPNANAPYPPQGGAGAPNYHPPQPYPPPMHPQPYPPPSANQPVPPNMNALHPPYPPPMQNYPPPPVVGAPVVVGAAPVCFTCNGKGQKLAEKENICPECKWLRPLVPGYNVDCRAFQWASDGVAMSKIRSMQSLQKVARTVSDKVGRRWIETTFDAIQLSENQLPEVYEQAILAARILAMEYMPDIYVSGNPAWEATTYGSDTNAFVVIGSALLMNFNAEELLFLFAREMGHCRAGHTLWKTVLHFLIGSQSTNVSNKGGGILRHLNIAALVTDAVELPLLAWARQSEITADRAGMLAQGNEQVVRKVLLAWSLKSPQLYDKINIEAWIQQQSAEGDDALSRVSEVVTSPVPYIARRLKLMSEFVTGNELKQARAIITNSMKQAGITIVGQKTKAAAKPQKAAENEAPAQTSEAKPPETKLPSEAKPEAEVIKIACTSCTTAMRIPLTAFGDKESLNVRCPNKECAKVLAVRRKPAATPTT